MTSKFRVVNVISDGQIVSEWYSKLETLLAKISSSSDRLAANYDLNRMDLSGHLSFDVLVNSNDSIVSFAGVYNGNRYPEGIYRVLNRTWVAEELRVKHGAFPMITSKLILPQQLERFRDRMKVIFVSRQRLSGRLFLEHWRQRQSCSEDWKVSSTLVQIVPDVEKKSCYQFICSRHLQDAHWEPKRISKNDWHSLPE